MVPHSVLLLLHSRRTAPVAAAVCALQPAVNWRYSQQSAEEQRAEWWRSERSAGNWSLKAAATKLDLLLEQDMGRWSQSDVQEDECVT